MFNYIKQSIQWDKDLPARAKMIDLYTRIYEGTIYDHLANFYFEERNSSGEYIPLYQRQPSHKTNFCKLVVDNSVSLLFGSDHFPKITCEDAALRQTLEDIIKEYKLNKIMTRAATIGSTGSVAIILRVYEGVLNIQSMNTKYLTPVFDKKYPDKLIKLTERYKVKGQTLIDSGYENIKEPTQYYWFERAWDDKAETYYIPYLCSEKNPQKNEDAKKTADHNLGFVPALWIKNLPRIIDSDENGAVIDGACTFKAAIDTNIEIDYQMSQLGRALKYSADPLLILKLEDDMVLQQNMIVTSDAGGGSQRKLARSASNAMVLSKDDEAKLLEISGTACNAVLEYVRTSREFLLESIQGNRSNADKVNAAQSGRAMQAMNQALIWLTDHLRVSYGHGGLLPVLQMIVQISNIPGYAILVDGKPISSLKKDEKISLDWPAWYPDTPGDKVQEANAIKMNKDAGILSSETGIKNIATNYNIEDIEQEKTQISKDQAELAARQPKLSQIQNI